MFEKLYYKIIDFVFLSLIIFILIYISKIYYLIFNFRVYDFNFLSNAHSCFNGTYKLLASNEAHLN